MDLVLPLILAFLSTGQSSTEATEKRCYARCRPGYYKIGDCVHSVETHRCGKCPGNTFTDRENSLLRCERCGACQHYEVTTQNCSSTSDVKCDCQIGSYYDSNRFCKLCSKKHSQEADDDYKRKCQSHADPPSTNPPTTVLTTTTTTKATATRTSNSTSNPVMNPLDHNSTTASQIPWLFLVGVMVTFLLLFGLLLFFREPLRYPASCPCSSVNKDLELPVEEPRFNEHHQSHRGSSPTTLTFNISEETPMMTLSQSSAPPEHPTSAHVSPLLPDAAHKAPRQEEQSEHWPAIVLYAIIKEVPLRRWKEFLRLLSVADQQLERVELEAGLGFMERQYQMLRLWSQRSSASMNDVFSALHYMDLSGCAQQLQESLEKLQWRYKPKQGVTSCRSYTDHGFSGAMQDT